MNLERTRIVWSDAHDLKPGEWTKGKGKLGYKVRTRGFILRETKKWVVVTHSVTSDNEGCCAIAIPKSCIVKRRDG